MEKIDIAHPPMRPEEAEQFLNDTLTRLRQERGPTTIKIIHGHGGSGVLKQLVQNWAYRNRSRFRAVIPGEEYDLFDPRTQEMRKNSASTTDSDLGSGNPGMTIIWVK